MLTLIKPVKPYVELLFDLNTLISGKSVKKVKDCKNLWLKIIDDGVSDRLIKTQNGFEVDVKDIIIVSHKSLKGLCLALKDRNIRSLQLTNITGDQMENQSIPWAKIIAVLQKEKLEAQEANKFFEAQLCLEGLGEYGKLTLNQFAVNKGIMNEVNTILDSTSKREKKNVAPPPTMQVSNNEIQIQFGDENARPIIVEDYKNTPEQKTGSISKEIKDFTDQLDLIELQTLWKVKSTSEAPNDRISISNGVGMIDCQDIVTPTGIGIQELCLALSKKGVECLHFINVDPEIMDRFNSAWCAILDSILQVKPDDYKTLFTFSVGSPAGNGGMRYPMQIMDIRTLRKFLNVYKLKIADQVVSGPSTLSDQVNTVYETKLAEMLKLREGNQRTVAQRKIEVNPHGFANAKRYIENLRLTKGGYSLNRIFISVVQKLFGRDPDKQKTVESVILKLKNIVGSEEDIIRESITIISKKLASIECHLIELPFKEGEEPYLDDELELHAHESKIFRIIKEQREDPYVLHVFKKVSSIGHLMKYHVIDLAYV